MSNTPKFNLIIAACLNGGIGIKGGLPWQLKAELKHFAKLTTQTQNPNKSNAVIMGRKTWFAIPDKFRPLPKRVNIVISETMSEFPGALHANSLQHALNLLSESPLKETIETVWIIGGQSLYNLAMTIEAKSLHRIYFTRVLSEFDCDAFFPIENLEQDGRVRCEDPTVPSEVQEENGIRYQYEIYENPR